MVYKNKFRFFTYVFCLTTVPFIVFSTQHTVIVGGGISGFLEAYYSYIENKNLHNDIAITIIDKNHSIHDTTTYNIAPSLTPDEILSVVPRGSALIDSLNKKFSDRGGIRVDDVPYINSSPISKKFIKSVENYSKDDQGHAARSQALMQLGKISMELWQKMYDESEQEFKQIMIDSDYLPCRETNANYLHDGYRIDLLTKLPKAHNKATDMSEAYVKLGYKNSKVLSPSEVLSIDPSLESFIMGNTTIINDSRTWNADSSAVWRPGGCINTTVFLPKLADYLKSKMGDKFNIIFGKKVQNVFLNKQRDTIQQLVLNNSAGIKEYFPIIKNNNSDVYSFVFCPGESVGTLKTLGFKEPDFAIFAGPTLKLIVPATNDLLAKYKDLFHCMEVHQEGVVLAWRLRYSEKDNSFHLATGGTKAFYGDITPQKSEEFAINRNLLQLNVINSIFPDLVSSVIGKNTKDKVLQTDDLNQLLKNKYAINWVGSRAVAYDGFPTLGKLYSEKNYTVILNGRATTHLGSGGVSFAPAVISMSRSIFTHSNELDDLAEKIEMFSRSDR